MSQGCLRTLPLRKGTVYTPYPFRVPLLGLVSIKSRICQLDRQSGGDADNWKSSTNGGLPVASRGWSVRRELSMFIEVQTVDGPKKVRVCDNCETVCTTSRFCCGHCSREFREREKEDRIRSKGTMLAREAIVEHLGGPWKKGTPGGKGLIDCPVCEKVLCLSFIRAASNGHIHATCRTLGCVSWME